MKVGIVGAGVVGHATRVVLDLRDVDVVFYDPPLGVLGDLTDAEIVFICVPTPFEELPAHLGLSAQDTSMVYQAIHGIPGEGKSIVIRSTVAPGTTSRLQTQVPQHTLFHMPEFLTEATAEEDALAPKRVVLGITGELEYEMMERVTAILDLMPKAPYVRVMNATDAEMVKYASNSFYALKVAYFNQLHDLCVKLGVNYFQVEASVAADPWIGAQHTDVKHGGYQGYGGKCLPKDVKTLLSVADGTLSILEAADRYNDGLRNG